MPTQLRPILLLQRFHLCRQFVKLRSEHVEHFALHVKFLLADHVHARQTSAKGRAQVFLQVFAGIASEYGFELSSEFVECHGQESSKPA